MRALGIKVKNEELCKMIVDVGSGVNDAIELPRAAANAKEAQILRHEGLLHINKREISFSRKPSWDRGIQSVHYPG